MGFSIGNIFKSVVSTVAPAIFKAVAPAVSKTLAGIADKFIGGAGSLVKGLVSGLPSPIASLFNKLIDKGVAAGQDLASPKNIQDLLARLTGMPREVAGAPAGTPPVTLPQIGSPERAAGQAAATAAGTAAIAQATASAGGNTNIRGSGSTIEDKAAARLGELTEPPFPGKDATEAELAQFQKDLGKYNRMYEMMSKIMANSHEMKKALIGNFPR
ncbi:MAG: hypothetical protein H6Q89_1397 [Myxococcaceae bacterium]|nr:hypothetical protein [Myxococcaceae bacterium]